MSRTASERIDPRFAHRSRQPGLDLFRAVAIIIVVIYHTGIFGFALPNVSIASDGLVLIFSLCLAAT